MSRFRDEGEVIEDFLDGVLACCPRCGGQAVIRPRPGRDPRPPADGILFAPRRVTCSACAYTAEWAGSGIRSSDRRDPYFHLPLWLQVSCAGRTLWACNRRHLAFLEQYVRAELREPHQPQGAEPRNRTLTSRLPAWIKSAKHRAALLAGIDTLKTRMPG